LGVYFLYDEELATKLIKTLNIWSSRDISIYGRVNVVKTLAISKLTFICSVLDTPDEVNSIILIRLHMEVEESKTQKNDHN